MDVNRDCIYGTRPVAPYREGSVCFTRKPGGAVYAVYLAGEDEKKIPSVFWLQGVRPRPGTPVRMLGVEGNLRWEISGKGVAVYIPENVQINPPCKYAWVMEIREAESM